MTNPNINPGEESIETRVNDLAILSEIVNRFMDVQRFTLRHDIYETDGEHTLHLQILAVVYAQRYHPELDVGKVGLYAMVHDFVEVYAGDVNSLQASDEHLAAKVIAEKLAFERLIRELGKTWPTLIKLIHDYEELVEPEARFVKCFDKIDPGFSHLANKGDALQRLGIFTIEEFSHLNARTTSRMEAYSEEFPDVIALRKELLQRVTEVAYPEV